MQMVPKFCFPFDVEREPPSPAVQHFTFALTDLTGTRRFGFCRLRPGAQSCLCILSHRPWFEVFYKLLNMVGDLLAQDQVPEAEELLLEILQKPPSGPQSSAELKLGSGVAVSSTHCILPPAPGNSRPLSCFVAPDSAGLPSIPENRNLTELVVAVTDENIVGLFAALLAERRVLVTSSKLSTLTSCVHASCALLYPMHWEHVLIPTLPPHLLDYCCAPMPYLIGVHASLAERVRDKALEDVVIMNVDANTLDTPFDDVQTLPPDVVSLLRLRLRKVALAPGEGVSRLFLKAQALLFGGYREALVCSPGQPVIFNEDAFLAQKPGSPLQAFHQRAVHLQLFKQFIEGRLEKLNTGEGFSDLFEQEITSSGASSGILRSYQLWADSLKKGGGALLHSVKSRTQPAVKNMYRTAKSSLKGMQNLLMYKDAVSCMQRGGSLRVPTPASRSDRLQQRLPITQHFGRNRPLRPSRRFRLQEGPSGGPLREWTPPLDPEDAQDPRDEDTLDGSFLGSGEELDLLSEILDSLSTSATRTGSLRPSQSLDCCHLGVLDSCSSLPDIPGSPQWSLEDEDEDPSKSQPPCLPAHSPCPPPASPQDTTPAQPPVEASPETMSSSPPARVEAEPRSCGAPEPPLSEPQPLILHLSPPQQMADEPRAQERPPSPPSTAPEQPPSPPGSPQRGVPIEPSVNAPALDSGSPERTQLYSGVLQVDHSPPQPLQEQRAPQFLSTTASGRQETQTRGHPRVAELKKCFES
ncbi:DENN domain-containing protein 1C [Sorex araneus]|uniref:DENN domain-containing protein 1C n=1 Tax=Sorex araneus TaxID=42254 RepID=UPI002433FB48|nr:DENN domain-containing protein 1C [Sorex araneus]